MLCSCGGEIHFIGNGDSIAENEKIFSTKDVSSAKAEFPLYLNNEGKCGFLDESGNILITARYDYARLYDNFVVFCYNVNNEPRAVVIDHSGT